MALETGTYINSLNASNPVSTDPISAADDHIRLTKSTIKATFPNITGAVDATHTEINTVADGGTTATATTLASTDAIVVNDAGTMKQVALSDLLTYLNTSLVNANAVTSATSLATIAADGTAVTVSGYTLPSTDGTADQQIKTDGSGNLSFFTPAAQFTAGNAIEINSGQIDHEDTSSQASVSNSNLNVIQDITLDTYGHVTAITSKDVSPPTDGLAIGSIIFGRMGPVNNTYYSGQLTITPGTGPTNESLHAVFWQGSTFDQPTLGTQITTGTWKSLTHGMSSNVNFGGLYAFWIRVS